ncbi:thioredoxin-like domain-containing protein [Chitinophaga sp. NPDC101104]|uniref:thioredoxin-like domain-containing protein n=1 Tax=Chitinophaga sp. NPDC101104 TaxID=3390561 RepID=UPI003D049345
MKKIIQIALGLLLPFGCLAADGFVIKGKVSGIISGYVSIVAPAVEGAAKAPGELPERVRIVDGAFIFTGSVAQPEVVELKVSTRTVRILLENTEYTVESTLQDLTGKHFKGSRLNDQYWDYLESQSPPLTYVAGHADAPISAFLVHAFTRELADVQKGYDLLSPSNKASHWGQEVAARLEQFKTTAAGKDMPDFSMTCPENEKFSIGSMAGKVVVLDFWASWCGPCRAFIPTMREYYKAWQPKGVEFVAVSFDDSRDKWIQAIAETGMEWKQGLIDGGFGADSPVKNKLNIKSIPHVIVVGKDGKIAAWLDYSMKSKLPEILSRLAP